MGRLTSTRSIAHRAVLVLLAVVVVLAFSATASACPTCKNALAENDPHHQNMVAGYFYSIIFMMSMPFLLITTFSLYMYREVRRARLRSAEGA
jgi:uncharacterized membrane protein YjgN (DUF898 family)